MSAVTDLECCPTPAPAACSLGTVVSDPLGRLLTSRGLWNSTIQSAP
jgi:hypothetical protein